MSILDTSENGAHSSRVTRHASRLDFSFKGNWLVRYDAREFAYPQILTLLPGLQNSLAQHSGNSKFIAVQFSHAFAYNRFFNDGDHLFVSHNGSAGRLSETEPGAFALRDHIEPLNKPIHSVNLLFPRLENDPRWKTIALPAAHLFLASNLQAKGFKATPLPLVLPLGKAAPGAFQADMAGFTLFEDLLPALRPFLADFKANFKGWLAAGGPFPTLAPLAAIYHLPQINLFVRGEAEQVLPKLLQALNQGDSAAFFSRKGIFWQQPGLIAMAGFDQVNRPDDFNAFQVDLGFLQKEHVEHGLEMNFSRGCGRGCMFCCHAQGMKLRELPLEKAEELLVAYKNKIENSIEALRSPRPLAGPPPLPRGVKNKNSLISDPSAVPPLLKGGDRGDFDVGTSTITRTFQTAWPSPRPLAGPPPLPRGVDSTKSTVCEIEDLLNQIPTNCNSKDAPPLLKGGDRGDLNLACLMNQTPANGDAKESWEGFKPSPTIGQIMGTTRRAPAENGNEGDNRAPALPCQSININDDDILQDPAYAGKIFSLIKEHGFRIHGIQTSPASLLESDGRAKAAVLDLAADTGLYVDGRPLVWLGTDVFLKSRAQRLGKLMPLPERFLQLLAELDRRGIRHFHYWISSDDQSDWRELVDELSLIFGFYRDFANFGLLAHAPFVVPYPSSRLFRNLPEKALNLKVRLDLRAPDPRFGYRVVERLETGWPQLNNLLKNDKAGGAKGFFDFLKEKNFVAAAQLAYHFLKQEELQGPISDTGLQRAQKKLEEVIAELLVLCQT